MLWYHFSFIFLQLNALTLCLACHADGSLVQSRGQRAVVREVKMRVQNLRSVKSLMFSPWGRGRWWWAGRWCLLSITPLALQAQPAQHHGNGEDKADSSWLVAIIMGAVLFWNVCCVQQVDDLVTWTCLSAGRPLSSRRPAAPQTWWAFQAFQLLVCWWWWVTTMTWKNLLLNLTQSLIFCQSISPGLCILLQSPTGCQRSRPSCWWWRPHSQWIWENVFEYRFFPILFWSFGS